MTTIISTAPRHPLPQDGDGVSFSRSHQRMNGRYGWWQPYGKCGAEKGILPSEFAPYHHKGDRLLQFWWTRLPFRPRIQPLGARVETVAVHSAAFHGQKWINQLFCCKFDFYSTRRQMYENICYVWNDTFNKKKVYNGHNNFWKHSYRHHWVKSSKTNVSYDFCP